MSRLIARTVRTWRGRTVRTVRPVRWGNLRRLQPISDKYGYDRGTSADRVLVDEFIAAHARDVRGRVLEVLEPLYAERHGAQVARTDILDIDARNPRATVVGDLGAAGCLPTATYDCVILTQTLYLVRDPVTALRNVYDALAPGGVLLLTTPAVARVDPTAGPDKDYWRLFPAGLAELFRVALPAEAAPEVSGRGNVLVAVCALMGIAAEELTSEQRAYEDDRFPVISVARVRKPS